MARRAQRCLGALALLGLGLGISLAGAEWVSRWVRPIYMTERVSLEGDPVEDWLTPGAVYYQRSSEYEALTTVTETGHRAPSPAGNPEVLFLGDSFTFGWGLADDQTFANLYCRETGRSCANLGAPGTGTTLQVERLETFLERFGWRPREVKLFTFAMTASFSAGNDLRDNYDLPRWRTGHPEDAAERPAGEGPGALERLLSLRSVLEEHSNLVRLAKYHWGPYLKSLLVPELDPARLAEALELTKAAFAELEELSRQYGFDYSIYLLHPVQDIRRGTHFDTARELGAIAPRPIRPTAQLFLDDPERYFFSLDGHLNAMGARSIADMLLKERG